MHTESSDGGLDLTSHTWERGSADSPESSTVPRPLGESSASWSKVRILPPALRMRLRARLVTRRAHTWAGAVGQALPRREHPVPRLPSRLTLSLGTSSTRTSSVMVPTTTAVLFSRPGSFIFRIWSAEGEGCHQRTPAPGGHPFSTTPTRFCTATHHPGQRQGRPVGAAHEQPLEHHLVEGRVGPPGQKPVELERRGVQ